MKSRSSQLLFQSWAQQVPPISPRWCISVHPGAHFQLFLRAFPQRTRVPVWTPNVSFVFICVICIWGENGRKSGSGLYCQIMAVDALHINLPLFRSSKRPCFFMTSLLSESMLSYIENADLQLHHIVSTVIMPSDWLSNCMLFCHVILQQNMFKLFKCPRRDLQCDRIDELRGRGMA